MFPLTSWEKRETAHSLAWYLCAHHSRHCNLVLQQMKTDYSNKIRIILPFKDQIAADAVCRQLHDLNVYINLDNRERARARNK